MVLMTGYYQLRFFNYMGNMKGKELVMNSMGVVTFYLMVYVFIVRLLFIKMFYTVFPFNYFYMEIVLSN